MTKAECRIIHAAVQTALQRVADQFELDLEVRPGSYDDTGYRPKVEFKARVVNGVPREQAEFARDCHLFGLTPEAYRKTVTINGEPFTVLGFNTKRTKYGLRVQRQRDGKILCATHTVIEHLQRMGFAAPSNLQEVSLDTILAGAQ